MLVRAPDDFAVKPVSFYEMPDRLWYPHGVSMWTDGGIDEQPDDLHYLGLLILEAMSSVKANTRHLLRQMGWIVSARIKELCLFRRRLVDFTGAGSIQASRCSIARVGALSSKLGEAVTNTKRKLKKPKRYSQM